MKYILSIGILLSLGACQTATAPEEPINEPQPITTISDERRAEINHCLVQIGKEPLPETLSGMNAPMNSEEAKAFNTCMNS